jgi:Flp pilus assembly protein TadD
MPEIRQILDKVKYAKAKEDISTLVGELTKLISKNKRNTKLLHARAELLIKLQLYGKAINDYHKILTIDDTDKQAAGQIDMLSRILRYSGNDIYSNPNTNLDPWLE